MSFNIKHIHGEECFDSLPVIKLCCDDSVDINERVYAQAQLGRNDKSFFARILSFEPKPDNAARLSLKLCCSGGCFEAWATPDESFSAAFNGKSTKSLTAYLISGEDLQGEYWGAVFSVPLSELLPVFKADVAALPITLTGSLKRENPAVSYAEGKFVLN